ncbi:DUF1688 family protein [Microbulbifer bruguierae]|uniref:DUF1688 family protein n=1 Tax=Microbulbifer bruguierae TaxID=3029061 RepID=A0ABY8NE41_9GAMM|nr:DUF1688 family protein [Microbulbifer bruguierae]WGL17190.1 DUF1688 family protein [Microbulbifer bruguierae]
MIRYGQLTAGEYSAVGWLFSTSAIRTQCARILERSLNGQTCFRVNYDRFDATVLYVIDTIRERYPDFAVPYHSRWRHFEVGEQRALLRLRELMNALAPAQRARMGFDLMVPSVFLDAGAGSRWRYRTAEGESIGRSEGLGLASLDSFLNGVFGGGIPYSCNLQGLGSLSEDRFRSAFQVHSSNPLEGVSGRVALLHNLASAMETKPELFPTQSPGDLATLLLESFGESIPASAVLGCTLEAFGDIWPSRVQWESRNLGDTWYYAPFGEGVESLVPFHKLSQWLSYSLIECLELAGFEVTGINELTALAEYRNGGLLIDTGLLELRNPSLADAPLAVESELVIEWRALTICLLDAIAEKIVDQLGFRAEDFPLAKVLEGGTWAAGRRIACERRGDLSPPLSLISDGTVF